MIYQISLTLNYCTAGQCSWWPTDGMQPWFTCSSQASTLPLFLPLLLLLWQLGVSGLPSLFRLLFPAPTPGGRAEWRPHSVCSQGERSLAVRSAGKATGLYTRQGEEPGCTDWMHGKRRNELPVWQGKSLEGLLLLCTTWGSAANGACGLPLPRHWLTLLYNKKYRWLLLSIQQLVPSQNALCVQAAQLLYRSCAELPEMHICTHSDNGGSWLASSLLCIHPGKLRHSLRWTVGLACFPSPWAAFGLSNGHQCYQQN